MGRPSHYDLAFVPLPSLDTVSKLLLYGPEGGLTAQSQVKRVREVVKKREAKKYISPRVKRYVPPGWIEQPTFR